MSAIAKHLKLAFAAGLTALTLSARPALAIDVQEVVSKSGIKAWLIESHEAPIIDVEFAFRGGALQDPPGKPGLAQVMAYSFNEGAGDLKTEEFIKQRDKLGIGLGASANDEYVNLGFSTVTEKKDEALALMELAMKRPRFDSSALEITRNYFINQYESAIRSPDSRLGERVNAVFFGKHRLSATSKEMLDAVKGISPDDIREIRRRLFARDNLSIGISGDIDAKEAAVWIDRLFSELPAKAEFLPEQPTAYAGPVREVIEMELPQASVIFGAPVLPLDERERLANALLGSVLNAGMTGRLFNEVREKRGLVYGIQANYSYNRLSGWYIGSFGSANATAAEALKVALDVLKDVAEKGPTDEEIATYKDSLAGGYLLNLGSNQAIAATLLNIQARGLPTSHFINYVKLVQSVTPAEVRAVAKKLIDVKNFSVLAVGRPSPAIPTN